MSNAPRRAGPSSGFDFAPFVRSDDVVAWLPGTGEPFGLTQRLVAQRHALPPLELFFGISASKTLKPEYTDRFKFRALNGAGTNRTLTAAAMFSMVAPAYAQKYGVPMEQLKRTLARIASKNHANGARNPRAQFRREMSVDQICAMPSVAGDLSVFDCAGVADGAAAAIVVRAEDAHRYTDKPIYVKALSFVAGNGSGLTDPEYDYTTFPEIVECARDAYQQAGVTDPRAQLAMAEVHDCFTPTELVLMEDLGFSERGMGWKDVLDGTFDLDGELPVNPDGGLKSFGHPIGASGLRMLFECWTQLRGEAGARQISSVAAGKTKALTHNLGGYPGEMVSFVSILGR